MVEQTVVSLVIITLIGWFDPVVTKIVSVDGTFTMFALVYLTNMMKWWEQVILFPLIATDPYIGLNWNTNS